jgi:hypothetical protein
MKNKKKIIIISLVVVLALIIALLLINNLSKKTDLANTQSICLTVNGENFELEQSSDEYNYIISTFDNKVIHHDTSRAYLFDENEYKIEITTGSTKYVLSAYLESPDKNGYYNDTIPFIIIDDNYNNSATDYNYYLVKIKKSEFKNIFDNYLSEEIK